MTLRFTCAEKKTCSSITKSQNIADIVACKISCCFFLSLLTAVIIQNSHILAGIYFIFLKRRRGPNEGYQY